MKVKISLSVVVEAPDDDSWLGPYQQAMSKVKNHLIHDADVRQGLVRDMDGQLMGRWELQVEHEEEVKL